jgi:hypothetical protein
MASWITFLWELWLVEDLSNLIPKRQGSWISNDVRNAPVTWCQWFTDFPTSV